MYTDLDRYFSCVQPKTDKREGVGGKREGQKEETNADTTNKNKEDWKQQRD